AIFRIVFDAMNAKSSPIFARIKGDVYFVDPEIPHDPQLDAALDLLDRATFALHTGKQASTPRARMAAAREAETTISAALSLLDQPPDATRSKPDDERHLWRDEIQRGLAAARSLTQPQSGEER
ncbi:MAG TPA: hypothetical protein VF510_17105, partial [Ktedonobacterales bacterium]